MPEKQTSRAQHPLCPKHWQKIRQETIKGLPFWSRPFAGSTVKKMLRDQGFFESEDECAFCKADCDVDEVN